MTDAPSATPPLDRAASFTLVTIAVVQAMLLYVAYEAALNDVALFSDREFLTLWYSLVLIPPGVVSLVLQRAGDRYAWLAGLGVAGVVGLLAWHTGAACGNDEAVYCDTVFPPYGLSLVAGHFILLPFIQGFRDHGTRIPYAALFHHAWDNALTGAAAGFFTGVAWLILFLGAGLFSLVGIGFLMELITFPGFIYPVTGLLAGFGIVLARHQAGALQAVLRVCLALGRALLPLISLVALAFLATLAFTGLQPLWDTNHATALLLLLIFGTVALVNGVLHDGTGVDSCRPVLRRLMGAALLTLPVYATIAATATSMRVNQYGWTVDRLWGALLVFIAASYALAYAGSVVVRRQGRWLGFLPNANVSVALVIVAVLLATQSVLLDFRAITVSSQLARLDDGRTAIDKFDFDYFRWELGRPGYEALVALRVDARVSASPELARKVSGLIGARQRWNSLASKLKLTPADFAIYPQGREVPPGLLDSINTGGVRGAAQCERNPCMLVAADLLDGPDPEWILVDTAARGWNVFPVFAGHGGQWRRVANIEGKDLLDDATVTALKHGQLHTVPVELRELTVGAKRWRPREIER